MDQTNISTSKHSNQDISEATAAVSSNRAEQNVLYAGLESDTDIE